MVLELYNTLTRKIEKFKPIKKGEVGMYVCGPTVNGVPHLGHARQQVTFDILRRVLRFNGFKVKFVSNITDVDDKIINKANELKRDIKEFTEENLKAHLEDYRSLNVEKPDVQPRATQYIKQMIELIKILEKKGYAYVISKDGVYFEISKFKNYGQLSHQSIEDLKAGARVEVKDEKKGKNDFALWKFAKENEPSWDSPWGKGRPGWHIECSAMSKENLGIPFDIHGGGQDLIFPHHEDELAQSEAAFDKKLVNYWVHNGMVNVENVKMSKSLGNYKTIKDLLKDYSGLIIRFFVLSNHYRMPIDFSKMALEGAKNSYERLKNIISEIKDDGKENERYLKDFEKAINDDLNIPKALAVLWELIRDEKAEGKMKTIEKMDSVFGLDLLKKEKIHIPEEIKKIAQEREKVRKEKNWKESDRMREELKKYGWEVLDKKEGYDLKRI